MSQYPKRGRQGTAQPAFKLAAEPVIDDRAARLARTIVDDGSAESHSGDAPPSNTASHNCNSDSLPYFLPLRWGVDSLYLSYPGQLSDDAQWQLGELKKLAQSSDLVQQAKAQLALSGHVFEVKDKGASMFPFILDDATFRIQLAKPSKTLPMAYAKVAAAYLSYRLPQDAEAHLRSLLGQLGELHERANVSRIDLFVDFVSSVDMEDWDRQAWVTRANSVNAYSVAGTFSGWSIGVGGIMGCRLYNKSLEHAQNGKNYLLPLWAEAGRQEGQTVWRLEFEFKREALTLKGLPKLDQVLANLNGLWSYATTDWLKLTIPSSTDTTRSRWPVHPLWACLASIDWDTSGGPLSNHYPDTRAPSDERLFSTGLSNLVSYMARENIDDLYQGNERFITDLYRFHDAKSARLGMSFDAYVAEKLALKRRQFNTGLNDPELTERLEAKRINEAAKQYRKASSS